MDELGSSLRHSDTPNFRVAPFMYLPSGTLESAIRLVSSFWRCFKLASSLMCDQLSYYAKRVCNTIFWTEDIDLVCCAFVESFLASTEAIRNC